MTDFIFEERVKACRALGFIPWTDIANLAIAKPDHVDIMQSIGNAWPDDMDIELVIDMLISLVEEEYVTSERNSQPMEE